MVPFFSRLIALPILVILCIQAQQSHFPESQTLDKAASGSEARERHPVIHRAIRALEAAKGYMEAAPHDFCGHRMAALAESNLALNQLGLAIICDKRRDRTSNGAITIPASAAAPVQERHPLLRQAISSLEAARRDLSNASHNYCGHRVEALESVNRAVTELKLALDCDKD